MSKTHSHLAVCFLFVFFCGCSSVKTTSQIVCPGIVREFINSNGNYTDFVRVPDDCDRYIQKAESILTENRIIPFNQAGDYLKTAVSVFVFSDRRQRYVIVWLFDTNKDCGDRRICGLGFNRTAREVLFYGQGNY